MNGVNVVTFAGAEISTTVDHGLAPPSGASAATAVNSLATSLAQLRFGDLSEAARHGALRCILDLIACAAAGRRHEAVGMGTAWARATFRQGDARVWFTDEQLSPAGAAFINSVAACVLDLDDGHRVASGHPGAAVIPAVIAVGETIGARLQDALLAIVSGYEAGIAVAQAREPSLLRGVATGRWSAVAVAAAVGKLRGFSAAELAHAIALAEAQAPNMLAADHAGFTGSHVKEGIPWSVLTGMAAAEQAALGMKGYLGALDNPAVYRARTESAGEERRFFIETTYFKPYACCRWTHSAIDALLDMRQRGLDPGAVEKIEIATFQRALTLGNATRPTDIIAAQFSLPFVAAAALVAGAEALLPMTPGLLASPDVAAMAERVVLVPDREMDCCFPAQAPARVRVETRHGAIEREVRQPLGDPANPMSDLQLVEKAVRLCASVRTAERIREFAGNLLGWTSASRASELLGTTLAVSD